MGLALTQGATASGSGGQLVYWGEGTWGAGLPQMRSVLRTTQIACGESHAIALLEDGSINAWGSNRYGQRAIPAGLGPARQVACGARHSIALQLDGTVVCWGGDGYNWDDHPPLGGVVQVVGLERHTIALNSDGVLTCWGAGGTLRDIPADIGTVRKVGGSWGHAVAVRVDGSVSCWGENANGQCNVPAKLPPCRDVAASEKQTVVLLENGEAATWGSPTWLPGGVGAATAIVAGRETWLTIKPSGEVDYWGYFNGPSNPIISNAASISAGAFFGAVLKKDGSVVIWGDNYDGQCNPPPPLGSVKAVAACNELSAAAIRSDGTMVSWGRPLGGEEYTIGINDFVSIAAGSAHMAAVREGGQVVCWGRPSAAVVPAGLPPIAQVACGIQHTLARGVDGSVVGWGDPYYGAIDVPVDLGPAIDIDCSSLHSMALTADGKIRSWGYDWSGPPPGDPTAIDIATGLSHSLALLTDGTIVVWGMYNAPPPEPGPYTAVAAGSSSMHSIALRADGTVVSWGYCDVGQCDTPAGLTGVTAIAGCRSGSYAIVGPERTSCTGGPDECAATLATSAGTWNDLRSWAWDGCGAQVPGPNSAVTLSEYGSVGAECDAQCGSLDMPAGSTLLVPIDLSDSTTWPNHRIEVGGTARLGGRIWLIARGAEVLPADLLVPVIDAADFDGLFSIIESTVPPPPGKFLTLVSSTGSGSTTWSLALRDLSATLSPGSGNSGALAGTAVTAEAMDLDGNGYDDLALVIDNGPGVPGLLQVILNDGAGNLGTASYIRQTASQPRTISIGHIDADGKEDAVVGTLSDTSARVYLNSFGGPQPFTSSTQFAVGSAPLSSTVLPYPEPRIAIGTAAGNVAIFDPAASAPIQQVPVPVIPTATGRRGRTIVSGGANITSGGSNPGATSGQLVVLTPGTDGTYANTQQIDVPGKPTNIDIADIDRDGFDDAMTANLSPQMVASGTPLAVLTLFRGTETGFGNATPIAPDGASAGRDVAMVDLNDDGIRDIVSVHQTSGGQSAAAMIAVSQDIAGGPLTLGQQSPIPATSPSLCPRGHILGSYAEGVFIIDAGAAGMLLTGGPNAVAIPYRLDAPECTGDLDGNGVIDGADLGRLLVTWGSPGDTTDLNRDGIVDGADLGVLLVGWGPCPN
jgi:alpha-tubulin suppressor-like RCC1 family protein